MAARVARFGVANDRVSALDSALPDRPRKRGRGGLEGTAGEGAAAGPAEKEGSGRGSKRANRGGAGAGAGGRNQQQQQRRGGRGQGGRRQGGGGGGGGGGVRKGGDKGAARTMDPAEKAKLEARAKRFATAA